MLQPNQQWHWYVRGEYLALELGKDMCFQTAHRLSSLTPCASSVEEFTLEQHAIYCAISEQFASLKGWSDAKKTQFAINALVLSCFGKPIAAKSWHFAPVPTMQGIMQYQVAYLKLTDQYLAVIVLELETSSAYCMLLDQHLKLDNGKVLAQFSPLKVMTNRLFNRPI